MIKFLYVDVSPITNSYRKPEQCAINIEAISSMRQYGNVVTLDIGGKTMTIIGTIADLLTMIEDIK